MRRPHQTHRCTVSNRTSSLAPRARPRTAGRHDLQEFAALLFAVEVTKTLDGLDPDRSADRRGSSAPVLAARAFCLHEEKRARRPSPSAAAIPPPHDLPTSAPSQLPRAADSQLVSPSPRNSSRSFRPNRPPRLPTFSSPFGSSSLDRRDGASQGAVGGAAEVRQGGHNGTRSFLKSSFLSLCLGMPEQQLTSAFCPLVVVSKPSDADDDAGFPTVHEPVYKARPERSASSSPPLTQAGAVVPCKTSDSLSFGLQSSLRSAERSPLGSPSWGSSGTL